MFHLSDFHLTLTDGLLLGLLIPVCIYLAYSVYRPGRRGRFAAWLLWGLRGLAFVLLLALLMEPILGVTIQHHRKPLVAVLVDNSESMRVKDDGVLRKDAALALLRGPALRSLEDRARMARFKFSDRLAPLGAGGVDSLRWDGRATDLAGALDGLREATAGEGLAGVVLISDGEHNLGGRPERAASDLGAPIYAVGIGSPKPPRDVALVSAAIDPLVYVGREVHVSVGLRSSGFNNARDVLVVTEDGKRVAVQPVVLADGEQTVRFQLRPDRPGRHAYRIALAPRAGERTTQNNAAVVSTQILRSRLRVLVAAGSPSPDLAYFRRLVSSDSNLAVDVEVATHPGAWPSRMQRLLQRPEAWDLVVLFDLPRAVIAGEAEQHLVAFVRGGGGLLVVGGRNSQGYDQSPLAAVLPLIYSRDDHAYRSGSFHPEIPEKALAHPILRITDDPLADRAAWSDLPPLLAYVRNGGARPGATVLVVHPTDRVRGAPMPLAAVMHAGAGKTMAVDFRTFWRFGLMMWGIGRTDAVSRAFWTNSVRWLVRREDVSRVQATVDRAVYRSGEPVSFHARVLNALLQPQAGARVTVSVSDSSGVREVALRGEGGGRYSGQMAGFPQGDYPFQVHAVKGSVDLGTGKGRFTVGRYSLEYEKIRMNAELLRDLAARSGGAFVPPDSLGAVLAALPLAPQPVRTVYRTRLWGKTWPLFALVLALAAEWTVRRRRGMI